MDNQTSTTQDHFIQVGKYKVKVDRNLCMGCGTCAALAANTFQLDNENKPVVKAGTSDTPENILAAAQACPASAIIIADAETGNQVFPN